jgi:hypothetical protein
MLHRIAPMPVTSRVANLSSESISPLALPELPVPQRGSLQEPAVMRLAAPESVEAGYRNSPQSVEMAVIKMENQRVPDRSFIANAPRNPPPVKTFLAHSYRPAHLVYEGFPAKTSAKGWDDILWRTLWTLCLVFGIFAVIALLVAGYNQL